MFDQINKKAKLPDPANEAHFFQFLTKVLITIAFIGQSILCDYLNSLCVVDDGKSA